MSNICVPSSNRDRKILPRLDEGTQKFINFLVDFPLIDKELVIRITIAKSF